MPFALYWNRDWKLSGANKKIENFDKNGIFPLFERFKVLIPPNLRSLVEICPLLCIGALLKQIKQLKILPKTDFFQFLNGLNQSLNYLFHLI